MTPHAGTLSEKTERLACILRARAPIAVAFSGGVDSSLLYAEARATLADRAVAVIGVSPSLAAADLEHARAVARDLEAPLWEVQTFELENPDYVANDGRRCFHCKSELFGRLSRDPRLAGWSLCDGTHADDRRSDRPGMEAARLAGVLSPLRECGFTKDDIRRLALARGLSCWDRPASPCLASRIQKGTRVATETLASVEAIEQILRLRGFRVFRARVDGPDLIVTIGEVELSRLGEAGWRAEVEHTADRLGFRRVLVDLRGYRPR